MDEGKNEEGRILGPIERCAELAAWHQLESDGELKEHIAAELAEQVIKAAHEDAERKAEQEANDKADAGKKAEADKAAKTEKRELEAKAREEAEAKAKAADIAEHAAWEKSLLERQEQQDRREHAKERVLDRALEVPAHIRESAAFQRMVEAQHQMQAKLIDEQARRFAAEQQANSYQGMKNEARMEAFEAQEKHQERQAEQMAQQDPAIPGVEKKADPYAKAASELDAKSVKEGQEIEGEVVEVAKVDGKNYYVVEQDGERLAVPAGDNPEHEKGDEITASRTKDGFETSSAYGYGR
jgi:hypothetical protein